MDAIYLDNNATTRPALEVIDAVIAALREDWANPSSVHRAGQAVRQKVELAREAVCGLLGCRDRELIFTSGATESVNLAIAGSLHASGGRSVFVTSKLEHSAVRETAEALSARGVEVVWLPNDAGGLIDRDSLRELLGRRGRDVAVVSIMWVNNETGVIQPIDQIGAICREFGVRFHSDITQGVGKLPIDLASLPVDLASFSAHKFHGPKGVGGLYVGRGVRVQRQISGGPQERDRRGGTENVPGIIGCGVAASLASAWLSTRQAPELEKMKDHFEQSVLGRVDACEINGRTSPRIWTTTNIGFDRLEAEAILLLLSERGVFASAGAACSSGSLDPSPVLLAMGVRSTLAHGSIRFSMSRNTTQDELERAVDLVSDAVSRLRAAAKVA
jgi:cysteine desulfurase